MVVDHINLKKLIIEFLISELIRYLKIIEIDLQQAQIHRVLWVFRKLSKAGLVVGLHSLTTIKVRNAENHLHDNVKNMEIKKFISQFRYFSLDVYRISEQTTTKAMISTHSLSACFVGPLFYSHTRIYTPIQSSHRKTYP